MPRYPYRNVRLTGIRLWYDRRKGREELAKVRQPGVVRRMEADMESLRTIALTGGSGQENGEMEYRILILEDDESLVDGLVWVLNREGYDTKTAGTVEEANALLEKMEFDLLLLDVSLPDGSGFEVCGQVRKRGADVPIIFLTAADEEVNVIRGLDGGGDDYITKPFRLGELCSRIRALLRRTRMAQPGRDSVLECAGLSIDLLSCRATLDGTALELTGVEYRLLCLLAQNAGRIVTRERILRKLWDEGSPYVDENTLAVYIRRLREKVEKDPSCPKRLITLRGFGYQWKTD